MPHSDQHLDEEELAILAFGGPHDAATGAHLADCGRCREELGSLRAVVVAAREPAFVTPPPEVWHHIQAATGVQTMPRTLVAERAERAERTSPPRQRGTSSVPAQRRPRTRVVTAVVATLALVVGVAIGVGVSRVGDTPRQPVVAQTRLGGLQLAPRASGRADVVETPAGRELDVDVSDLNSPDGFYQVWLIDPTVTKMVPVGVLNGDVGRWSLPNDMNLADYPVVDISAEPLDGNPAHSGKSVLRGTLKL